MAAGKAADTVAGLAEAADTAVGSAAADTAAVGTAAAGWDRIALAWVNATFQVALVC